MDWFDINYYKVIQYIRSNFEDFWNEQKYLEMFRSEPNLWRYVIEDSFMSNEEKIRKYLHFIKNNSLISVLAGKRNSGKTVFNFWEAEILAKWGYKIFYINADFEPPEFIKVVDFDKEQPYLNVLASFYPEIQRKKSYEEVITYLRTTKKKPYNVMIHHDEVHKDIRGNFMSRENQLIRSFIAEIRKFTKSLSIRYTSQTLYGIPPDLFRYSDYQIFKEFNYFQLEMDRQTAVMDNIEYILPTTKSDVLVTGGLVTKFKNPLPLFFHKD